MRKYNITGMTCASCSSRVEKAVSKLNGVSSVSVNLLTNSMGVEGTATDEEIIVAVKKSGYGATKVADNAHKPTLDTKEETPYELKASIQRLVISSVFLLVLLYFSMGHNMWSWQLPQYFQGNHVAVGLFQMLLCIVIIFINKKFFINGFKGIFRGQVNMDTLVGLGSGVAFVYSVVVLFLMVGAQNIGDINAVVEYSKSFYFESSAMILTLITLGKTLEIYSKGKTTNALKSLMKLTPKTATILKDNTETIVPISSVCVGDMFVVRAGESIPVDGEVVEGASSVDEAMLTGESIPLDKTKGSKVSAGTMNLNGFLKCRSTRVGEDTTLSQIIRMVSDASATKAPVSRIADKVSAVFVPIVLAISIITLIAWLIANQDIGYALARAISVLVISCPCALGLATPVAIMVGSGLGAKNGILFKTSAVLERTGKVDIVVLDKTGTITNGTPEVTDIVPFGSTTKDELITLAYTLESQSEHPLSKAIIDYAKNNNIIRNENITDFKVLSGNGLSCSYNGQSIVGGNKQFISSIVNIPDDISDTADTLSLDGKTVLYFSYGTTFLGMIAVADTIRTDIKNAITQLHDMGIKVVMLTGDNQKTAKAIARIAGIDNVVAEVLPNEKESIIRKLKQYGKVMMVGDGINDAPALTSADVGVAIGAGTDIAIDSAEVVLVNSKLTDIPATIRLSKRTLLNIKENLFWAFIYNIIGIPLATGMWIPLLGITLTPMFGAMAMSLSSVCVVLNALRLNLYDIRKPSKLTKTSKDISLDEYNKGENMENTITLNVTGMMCGHCENSVKKALANIDGVSNVTADHETGKVQITTTKEVPLESIHKAIEALDYKITK